MKGVILPIMTDRLLIRKLTVNDLEDIVGLCEQSRLGDWFPRWDMTPEQALGFLNWQISKYDTFNVESDVVGFGIELRSSSTFIGHCSVGKHDELDEVEISYGISKYYRGHGYATEAAIALSNWSLDTFDLPRVIGTVELGNVPSMRVMEKSGFVLKEVKTLYYGGEGSDFNYYTVEKPESV